MKKIIFTILLIILLSSCQKDNKSINTGVISTGVTSTGVTSTGVTSTGVTSTGVTSTGVTSTGVTSTGEDDFSGKTQEEVVKELGDSVDSIFNMIDNDVK